MWGMRSVAATLMLGLQNEREWQIFCEQVLLQPALAKDSRFDTNSKRSAARGALRGEIDAVFAHLTADQVAERLESAGIANAQVRDMAGLWAHPQLAARGAWTTVASAAGDLPALWPVGRKNGCHPCHWGTYLHNFDGTWVSSSSEKLITF
jgi:itaconate CoA-transferase